MACFDLSGLAPLSQGTRQKYINAWNVYDKVQAYDIAVSTLRSQGDRSKTYWQFATAQEHENWRIGLSLHVKRYPNQNWNPPQKN
uniref:Uncharacterized protein n=1 Tax=viral metagenome TaxID=1070528 RepID=A0A6C0JXL1_9ZZZZ